MFLAFRVVIFFQFSIQSHCSAWLSKSPSFFNFGIQSRCSYLVKDSEPPFFPISGVQSHYFFPVMASKATIFSYFRHSKPPSLQLRCSELSFLVCHSESSFIVQRSKTSFIVWHSKSLFPDQHSKPPSFLSSVFRAIVGYSGLHFGHLEPHFRHSKPYLQHSDLPVFSSTFRTTIFISVQSHHLHRRSEPPFFSQFRHSEPHSLHLEPPSQIGVQSHSLS